MTLEQLHITWHGSITWHVYLYYIYCKLRKKNDDHKKTMLTTATKSKTTFDTWENESSFTNCNNRDMYTICNGLLTKFDLPN